MPSYKLEPGMLHHVKPTGDADWESLARRGAYFPILCSDGGLRVESEADIDAFLATGETDIASLFDAISTLLGRELRPAATLDFGCGAGRLTIPLAKRSGRVLGCDVAPTMLAHARQNLDRAGFPDLPLILNDALVALPAGSFDLVCSLLVFQYIPRSAGFALIRTLIELLAPDGIAALHVMLEQPGDRMRRLQRFLGRSSTRGMVAVSEDASESVLHLHRYDEMRIAREVEASGARVAGCLPLQGEGTGSVLIITRQTTVLAI